MFPILSELLDDLPHRYHSHDFNALTGDYLDSSSIPLRSHVAKSRRQTSLSSGNTTNPNQYELLYDLPHRYHSHDFNALTGDYLDSSIPLRSHVAKPRRQTSLYSGHITNPNQYRVMLNVQQFRPEEIVVRIVDNTVVIHGKHKLQADEHGFISREFSRRLQLPGDVEPDTVKASLSPFGVLTIMAPRKQLEPPPQYERIVPITIKQPASKESASLEEALKQQPQEQQNTQQQSSEE